MGSRERHPVAIVNVLRRGQKRTFGLLEIRPRERVSVGREHYSGRVEIRQYPVLGLRVPQRVRNERQGIDQDGQGTETIGHAVLPPLNRISCIR